MVRETCSVWLISGVLSTISEQYFALFDLISHGLHNSLTYALNQLILNDITQICGVAGSTLNQTYMMFYHSVKLCREFNFFKEVSIIWSYRASDVPLRPIFLSAKD